MLYEHIVHHQNVAAKQLDAVGVSPGHLADVLNDVHLDRAAVPVERVGRELRLPHVEREVRRVILQERPVLRVRLVEPNIFP